ncbi:putative monocarboxylate transporter [Aspergillus fischeri NRRL 181]|uniref:Monocarboxylate permease homologue, mch4 n=1 Tax=Neosartorya fischeri (strain ATCC 1020 / DSM 3700 / CBS 544.65 / FGSC A1164 / JCM 1740 / NRRL 181 / WB 181) TaxID=331117 RepID=A1DKT2_NEOFI|nr:monocarboxylate permease homologue, mch4 [Aspergillus fischeri NRRL 181]EAW15403.1 monocarboxylate permease homologue, mch4 [Aspergillus fischeri NRRL 181]
MSDARLEKGLDEPATEAQKPHHHLQVSRTAWLTVAGASVALFVSFGWVNCIGLFQAEYEANQLKDYSSSDVSWITSMEFFFMLFTSPVAGKLFDSYGPRLPIAIGSVLHIFGLMMASLSHKYYQFMLSQSVPQTWFRQKRGIVGGLTVAGSSLGGVIFPLMVQHLLPQVGFGWTMRICAFLILGLLVIANLTISSYFRHAPRPFSVMHYLGPLRALNFGILCTASFFMYWGLFIPFDYIAVEAIHYGMSSHMAWSLVPILNGASFFGRTMPNYIADKVGRFNVMLVMTSLSAILVLALWLPARGNGALITFAALFGITSGAIIGLGPVLIVSISPMSELGYRMGTVLAFAAVGTLTSPPIRGAIAADSGGSYTYTCVFSAVSFILGTIGLAALRVRLSGWGLTTKI